MLRITRLFIWAFLLLNSVPTTVNAQDKNGFDLADSLIPVDEIHQGGPPRDGNIRSQIVPTTVSSLN
ncbi:MAG: hypothetical protein P8M72_05570 [Gammaproteobacteria bacterium]|nr:hypothetical protein [Gammaproteobacteria bacterium]